MKQALSLFIALGALVLLGGCAPINDQFSCNQTAGDHCLSIEEVNAMTEMGQEKEVPRRPGRVAPRKTSNHANRHTQTIWMAPWIDEKGIRHENDTLFADIKLNKATT